MTPESFVLTCVYLLAGVLGLCVGSFLNVVIYRLPKGMSLAVPGSHCTACGYSLKWYDNIPVLSYLFLGGKCRKCGVAISPRYMLVELTNGLLWLLCVRLFWQSQPGYAVVSALVLSVLICVFCIDWEHLLIFDRFVLLIALAGLAMLFFDEFARWQDHVIGALSFGGGFGLIYFGVLWLLKKEGLGFGDVKLAFAAGLLLGWQRMLLAILVASVSGSILLMLLRRAKHHEKDHEYPFGPFLVTGIALALLAGEPIIRWYLTLLGI